MSKFAKIACLVALCSGFAIGCGDDDGDSGGGGKVEGCIIDDNDTCQESEGISAACGLLGGADGTCSKDKLDGTCVYTESGHSTTVYYYKKDNGDAWGDDFGTAEDDCKDLDGKYTAK